MTASLHISKYMCICTRINTLLLVSLCNEQILALVLEERSPLKWNAWFIMMASPAPLNFVIFLSSSILAICCSFHIRPSEFGPGTSHVWKLQISVRNIHLSTLGVVCHNDGIWGNGTVFESNSAKLNIAKNGTRTAVCHDELLRRLKKTCSLKLFFPLVRRHCIFGFVGQVRVYVLLITQSATFRGASVWFGK